MKQILLSTASVIALSLPMLAAPAQAASEFVSTSGGYIDISDAAVAALATRPVYDPSVEKQKIYQAIKSATSTTTPDGRTVISPFDPVHQIISINPDGTYIVRNNPGYVNRPIVSPTARQMAEWDATLMASATSSATKFSNDATRADSAYQNQLFNSRAAAQNAKDQQARDADDAKLNAVLKGVSDRAVALGLSQQSYNQVMIRALGEINSRVATDSEKSVNGIMPVDYAYTTPETDAYLKDLGAAIKQGGGGTGAQTDPIVNKYETWRGITDLGVTQAQARRKVNAQKIADRSNPSRPDLAIDSTGTVHYVGGGEFRGEVSPELRAALIARRDGGSGSTITLSLPAAGGVKTLANGVTVDDKGVLRNANGTTIGILDEKGQFIDPYTKKPVSAAQANEWLGLFNGKASGGTAECRGVSNVDNVNYIQKNAYISATDDGAIRE